MTPEVTFSSVLLPPSVGLFDEEGVPSGFMSSNDLESSGKVSLGALDLSEPWPS